VPDPETPRRPPEWLALARRTYDAYLKELSRHGVSVDPGLRFVTGATPEIYYEPDTLSINVGVADPDQPSGHLYWLFMARLLGVTSADEAMAVFAQQLPLLIVHEMTHHLRQRYGAPTVDDFVEEQVVNIVAVSFIAEHADYSASMRELREFAGKAWPKLAAMAPAAAPARAGFRLDLGDVLVEHESITRRRLEELRALSEHLDRPLTDVLDETDVVSDAQLDQAAAAQDTSHEYFNRRYMADPTEYQSFHTDWFRSYLERREFPALSAVLEEHILTDDWERTRSREVASFMVDALHGASPDLAVAAAEALLLEPPEVLPPELMTEPDELRPAVLAAVLRGAARHGAASRHPALVAAAQRQITAGQPDLRAAAAVLLVVTDDVPTGLETLRSMLAGHPDERSAALLDLEGLPLRGLEDALVAVAAHGHASDRARALRALPLAVDGAAVAVALRALDDPDDAVRAAAASALGESADPAVMTRLAVALGDPADGVRRSAATALRACGEAARHVLEAVDDAWEPRVEASLALHALQHPARSCAAGAYALVTRLVVAAEGLTRPPDLAADTTPAIRDLVLDALDEERIRLAVLAARVSVGGVCGTSGNEVVVPGLTSADLGVRRTAAGLAARAVPPDLRKRLLALFEPVVTTARSDSVGVEAPRPTEQPDSWLTRLLAQARNVRAEVEPRSEGDQMMTAVEKLVHVRAVPVFRTVAVRELWHLAEDFVAERYLRGEQIFGVGDDDQRLYVLAAGRVAIHQDRPDGSLALVAELRPGQSFGESAMLEGRSRSAAATAVAEVTLLALDREQFLRLGSREPQILVEVTRTLARLLRTANADLG